MALQIVKESDVRLETLVSSTLFLMSAFVRQGGSVRLASIILRHLEQLAERAEVGSVLAATCDQVADHWAVLARPRPDDGGRA